MRCDGGARDGGVETLVTVHSFERGGFGLGLGIWRDPLRGRRSGGSAIPSGWWGTSRGGSGCALWWWSSKWRIWGGVSESGVGSIDQFCGCGSELSELDLLVVKGGAVLELQ